MPAGLQDAPVIQYICSNNPGASMKNIFTLTAALAFSCIAAAQITITKTDMPNAGDNIIVSMTGNFGTADPSATGPNYSWNFTFLTPDSQKVDSFVTVSSTPFPYQFFFNNPFMYPNHAASYASPVFTPSFNTQFQVEDVYNYYKESTPEYSFVGFGATINGAPASVKYDSIDVIYTFPMNYGNSDSCWSKYGFNVPGFGYYGQTKHRVNYVDGWGTLMTPYGTFQALRVRSVIDATDTIYYSNFNFGITAPRPREIEYKWLGTGSKIPLLQVNTQVAFSNENITAITYRDSLRNNAVEPVAANELAASVYPNPAEGKMLISYSIATAGEVRVEVYDLAGSVMLRAEEGKQPAGPHVLTLDAEMLAGGMYMLKIEAGNYTAYKKVVIK